MFLLVFLLMTAGMMPTAQAQSETKTFYTLTNGNLWWIDGDNPPAEQDAANRYVRGWDQSNSWAEIRTLGSHAGQNTTIIVSQGEVYLKLDTLFNALTGKPEPRLVPWRVAEVNSFGTHGLYNDLTQGFDQLCLWERSSTTGGETGFYYQDWWNYRDGNTYRYRLNHYVDAQGNNLIRVDATAIGEPVNRETEWYDWDFGAAVTVTENNSSRYYWIMFDTIGNPNNIMDGKWDTMSNHSYQRPDEIMYNPYYGVSGTCNTCDDPTYPDPNMTYYDNRIIYGLGGTKVRNIPHGMPAIVMPVKATYNDREIGKIVDGKGLQDVLGKKKGEDGDPYEIRDKELTYEDTLVLNANITYNRDRIIIMKVLPEYNMFVEENYRRGIALGYQYRESETFGSNGVATRDTIYYWPEVYGGTYLKHKNMPDTLNDETTVDSVKYSVDPRSSRYLTLDNSRNNETNNYELSFIVSEPPVSRHSVHLTTTVYYSNGTSEVHKDTLYISYTPERTVVRSRRGPAIGGMVFGGGRVANVGWDYGSNEVGSETNDIVGGNTHITVHSADTIYALYGGNDIAGWVQGEKGATIQLGTELTSEEHPVHIGYVYGGGCGYYSYGGMYDLAERIAGHEESTWWRDNSELSGRGIFGGDYAFQGKVYPWGTTNTEGATPVVNHTFAFTPSGNIANFAHAEKGQSTHTDETYSGTIPYIRTSHITVGVSDTVDDYHYLHNDYVLIDSLFGGAENAYIGVTASEEEPANGVTIDINGGTLMTVFGGNNYGGQVATTSTVFVDVFNTKLTDEENIENTLLSGYGRDFGIRHLFGGGNMVDGSHANVRILGGMCDTVFLGGNNATVTKAFGTVECLRNGKIDRFGHNGHFIWTNPTTDTTDNCRNTNIDEWEGDQGRYNIRCLFGGNNAATMSTVSMVQLHSGGVCSIYGGGNAGDMNNDGYSGVSLPSIYNNLLLKSLGPNEAPYNSGWDGPMPGMIGSIVTALHTSNIICEYVYGGCRQANVKYSCGVYAAGGAFGYINGGNDVSGDVGSTIARNYGGVEIPIPNSISTLRKGTAEGTYVVVDSNVVVFGDIYGGSDGYLHCSDPKKPGYYNDEDLYDTYTGVAYDPYHEHVGKLIPTHNNTNVHIKGGLIMGNVYSAGINASVGFAANGHIRYPGETWENPSILRPADGVKMGEVHTTISGGEIQGQVFGGGFMASIYGIAYLNIKGNAHINTVFAGNDVAGQVTSFGSYHSSTIPGYAEAATDEARKAAFNASCSTYVNSLDEQLNEYNSVEDKYEANYSVYVRVEDSVRIHTLYGSGNGEWDYTGETESIDDDISICNADLGNLPHQKSAFLDINTSGGYIDTIYGGGDGAGVQDKVVVLLNNTKIDNVDETHHRGEWSSDEESMYHWDVGNDALAEARKKIFVGTIFGGNNHDEMATCVPEIRLTKGSAKNVYGGANAGTMGWHETFKDANNNDVKGVTTYVKVNSDNVYITDTVFGGCRMGDVAGMSYVDVTKTHEKGINYLYGGNDISGLIGGNTRVDVSGGTVHHIWGGSNGRYDFIPIGDQMNKIYPYGTTTTGNPADSAGRMITIAGKPDVDSSNVNIWGGDINTTVYGGGSMADCRATCVVIDDRLGGSDTAVIAGSVYAGGEGDWENLNNEHRGNVTEASHLHLYHASQISDAKAYGGGKGGDVAETFIKTYSAWDKPFLELYGGCWGSDVSGTAHLDFEGINLVYHLYGGNDFTGNVNRSVINVYSGKFKNIYGAGNGTYPASDYNTGVYGDNKFITRPNNEYVELNIYDGLVDSCVYGGGRMGTVFRYERNSNGTYHLVPREGETEPSVKVPDTTLTWDLTQANRAHKDPAEYSYIILNMHGGQIMKNVFAGGCGDYQDVKQTPIVYGLKNVNMDGGYIFESLYGGSEFVHDGYMAECTDHQSAKTYDRTTKRPSSIVNITGGTVNGFLYGGGYLGDVYGSTYVNVGTTALDTCRAYRNTIADSVEAYSKFKPGADGGLVDAMGHSEDLYINHSIYAGANWGTNTGNTSFTKEGYHGGESRVVIDGKDYQTTIVSGGSDPAMNIRKSIIGAGTSALAGDIVSTVELRNYGEVDNCAVSKQLESIQRADSVTIHNTAVEYTGSTNAASAFVSEPYSMLNLGVLNFRGYNVAQMDAIVDYIGELNVYEDALVLGQLKLVENTTLVHDALTTGCEDDCAKLNLVDPYTSGKQHTLLMLNNGVDVTLQSNSEYGEVHGYSYVATNNGFSSTIVGKNVKNNDTDDGFVATCQDSNKVADDRLADNITWNARTNDNAEHVFTNYNSKNYRVWRAGDGLRKRETTILAHTVPDSLPNSDVAVLFKNGALKLAIAEAEVTLPATDGGNYYLLDGSSGFSISGENAPLNLVDSAWVTTHSGGVNGDNSIRQAHAAHAYTYEDADPAHGTWEQAALSTESLRTGVAEIQRSANNTFGLVMVPVTTGEYAASTPIYPDEGTPSVNLVVSGNSYVNSAAVYRSPQVAAGSQIRPKMRFYLTYDTNFTSAFLGTVSFVLKEMKPAGAEGTAGDLEVGKVEVKVYISTIVEDFKDMEEDVVAIYNNGRTNTFTRKVMLPAVMEERDLYLTGVKWVPTNATTGNGEEIDPASVAYTTDHFFLVPDEAAVTSTDSYYPRTIEPWANHTDHSSHNRFALSVVPGENISTDLNAVIGWNSLRMDTINVYRLIDSTGTGVREGAGTWSTDTMLSQELPGFTPAGATQAYGANGLMIGTLNGRGSTVLNVNLNFDGNRTYDGINGKGFVGKVVLTFKSIHNEEDRGTFHLTINVKTREHGDTIYIASKPDYVERGGVKVFPYKYSYRYTHASVGELLRDKVILGKSPGCYVNTFQQALSTGVYQEGDVLCIIDTVKIGSGQNVFIQGATGPAIEVIRYEGHHHDLPGESCVYRGPMVQVKSSSATFSARNIAFHGGAGGHVKDCKRDGSGNPEYSSVFANDPNPSLQDNPFPGTQYYVPLTVGNARPDTNIAFAPIIQVMDSGTVTLSDGTSVKHNWNGYGARASERTNGIADLSRNMGAVSLTNGGTLKLQNNVTFSDNFVHTMPVDSVAAGNSLYDPHKPGNGTIYIDGGILELEESSPLSSIQITENHLMNPGIHGGRPDTVRWWSYYPDPANPSTATRWEVNRAKYANWPKANVYLTRTQPSTGNIVKDTMNDVKSDLILVSGTQSNSSNIGVRKWFPGVTMRDTMAFATFEGGDNSILSEAVYNDVFSSDDNERIFYNTKVNSMYAYLFRCATFKHQWYASGTHTTIDPLAVIDANDDGTPDFTTTEIKSNNPLHFGYIESSCPLGGDSIIYRLQGGFAPYTYTWSDPDFTETMRTAETPYANAVVQKDLLDGTLSNEERLEKYLASIADTLYLPYTKLPSDEAAFSHTLRVTATDATGECILYKDLNLTINRSFDNTPTPITYFASTSTAEQRADTNNWSRTPTDGWTDTAHTKIAYGSRNYKAIHVVPYVWVDRSSGTISAMVAGDDNDHVYEYVSESEHHELSDLYFCEGDIVVLKAREPYTNVTPNTHFLMWDFDPYYKNPAAYVVPPHESDVIAYFGPNQYWHEHVNEPSDANAAYDNHYYYERPTGANYATSYHGDVHIYNEEGLAWFISVVNGLNGVQARQFYFNKVYLHDKTGGYNMKDYLWTPVGTEHQPFRGWFIGVGSGDTDTEPLDGSKVVVKNIIINEPEMDYTGFFGNLDTARISGIELQGVFARGAQYVGALAAGSRDAKVDNVAVTTNEEGELINTTTILTTHYVSGGLIGQSNNDKITNSMSFAKYVGDAVYSGGIIGYGNADTLHNSVARNDNRMSGVYVGGLVGYSTGDDNQKAAKGLKRLFGSKSKASSKSSHIANNYVMLVSNGHSNRVGGLVGYAQNTVLENNYVYGEVVGENNDGGVAATLANSSKADRNYYAEDASKQAVGNTAGDATLTNTASFKGKGNQVSISNPVGGINNLTRVLNAWVRQQNAQGGNYKTWRSDLETVNNGYPIYGTPDMIPVRDSMTVYGCDSIEWEGIAYNDGDTISRRVIDNEEMIDSTMYIRFVLHYGSVVNLSDSAILGEAYEGHGFTMSQEESELLRNNLDSLGQATVVLTDTVQSIYGCDSIVSLTLIFHDTIVNHPESASTSPSDVRAYPNPTLNYVTIEAAGMQHVELYDNEGRKLEDYDANGNETITINVANRATGIYYLRIHAGDNVTIQKLIKQ